MLGDPATTEWTHADLEDRLAAPGRELLRSLAQDHLDLRAEREQTRTGVVDAGGLARTRVESGHGRTLRTVCGPVQVWRKAYRAPGVENLYPADAVLNMPGGKHSQGLRRLAAVEATRGSFDDAAAAIGRATGTRIGKRQVEDLTGRRGRRAGVLHRPPPGPRLSAGHSRVVRGRQGGGDAPCHFAGLRKRAVVPLITHAAERYPSGRSNNHLNQRAPAPGQRDHRMIVWRADLRLRPTGGPTGSAGYRGGDRRRGLGGPASQTRLTHRNQVPLRH